MTSCVRATRAVLYRESKNGLAREGLERGRIESGDPKERGWSVRVRRIDDRESRAYSGKSVFSVGRQASFSGEETIPTSVEYLLGALGGDLISGFQRSAAKRGVPIEGAEVVVTGRLDNPLVFLGVVGAKGSPSFDSITAVLYVGADAEERVLREIWASTLAMSPLVTTLERCLRLDLKIQPT